MAALSKVASSNSTLDWLKALLETRKGKISGILVIGVVLALLAQRKSRRVNKGFDLKNKAKKGRKGRGQIDGVFFYRLFKLIKICIPSLSEPVLIDFMILNGALFMRTVLSIMISTQNGLIVKSIIDAKWYLFLRRISTLALYSFPASFLNSFLEYLNKKIALSFRENLNTFFHKEYVRDNIYYKTTTIDARLPNPDQRLTEDINKWAHALSSLYSNVSKPTLDIFLFSKKLAEIMGWSGPIFLIGWYSCSAVILKLISPAFGMLTAQLQRLEGEFRASHSNLSHHSEEIAFYRGDKFENVMADNIFDKLYAHTKVVALKRLYMGTFDSMLFKYGAVLVSYGVLGIPVFGASKEKYMESIQGDSSSITRDYVRNSGLIISLAKAMGRILISYKEVQLLAGYTTVVYELKEVIDDLKNKKYCRHMIDSEASAEDAVIDADQPPPTQTMVKGKIEYDNQIRFYDVPLNAPNGEKLLANPLRFVLNQGKNCLFFGPNGCGKTSLYRILSQLWPMPGGELTMPPKKDILFLPQKAYLPKGTLRDQIIYPDFESKMSNNELRQIMSLVDLDQLYQRLMPKGGFDAVEAWDSTLSGGQRQKISFARVFYHKPKFAVLDESSSAISMDFEHVLYQKCREHNITMFTISMRESLFPFHDFLLRFDGSKEWSFEQIQHSKDEPQDYKQI